VELNELNSFTEKDIELFREYSVITVDQFMGISFGLSKEGVLSLLENRDEVIRELTNMFSTKEIEEYRKGYKLPAMGCIRGEIDG